MKERAAGVKRDIEREYNRMCRPIIVIKAITVVVKREHIEVGGTACEL